VNPYVDLLGWSIVAVCVVALWFEIPRAVREIRKILARSRAVQSHISRGQMVCPTCEIETHDRFWHRCPSCGSSHQPV
jgi:Zn finger protein HypA/HybF involved in hydrogenase expression